MTIESAKIMGFVPTRDAVKSRTFYEGVLGLRFVEENPFAVVPQNELH